MARRGGRTRYVLEWNNRWLTAEATTIEEMADALQTAAARLREMAEQGIELDEDSAIDEDEAVLVTHDEDVAGQFDFDEDERAEDEDEDG